MSLQEQIEARRRAQQEAATGAPSKSQAQVIAERMRADMADQAAVHLLFDQIEVRAQARKTFRDADLQALADNIRQYGQLQPIVVKAEGHRYRLIAGERRLRAMRDILQAPYIAARITEQLEDEVTVRLAQLSENEQRADYEPLEYAAELAALQQLRGWSNKELAQHLHRSEPWVSRKLGLLKADASIQQALQAGTLSEREYYAAKTALRYAPAALDAPAARMPGAETPEVPETRIATVTLPWSVAMDLAQLLKRLTEERGLNPVTLTAKPTKKALVALLTTRAHEILKSR